MRRLNQLEYLDTESSCCWDLNPGNLRLTKAALYQLSYGSDLFCGLFTFFYNFPSR